MRGRLLAGVAVLGLLGKPLIGPVAAALPPIDVCFQAFNQNDVTAGHLPHPHQGHQDLCADTASLTQKEKTDLKVIQTSVLPTLLSKIANSVPEGYQLFAAPGGGDNVKIRIFIKGRDYTGTVHGLQLDVTNAISWVSYDLSSNPKTLYIGISEGVFPGTGLSFKKPYSLPVHITAEFMELFWSPNNPGGGNYIPGSMPRFTMPNPVSGGMDDSNMAVLSILVHEIAHFWEAEHKIYDYASSSSSGFTPCRNPQGPLPPHAFATISWSDIMDDNSNEYFPPWTQTGVWGCATTGTPAYELNQFIFSHVPLLSQGPGQTNGGAIQNWPDRNYNKGQNIADFVNLLYDPNSGMPTALAAVSPEEDFADSYTMLALYRAGLTSLCLYVPGTSPGYDVKKDVLQSLFVPTSYFQKKVTWILDFVSTHLPLPPNATISISPLPNTYSSPC